jgi:Anthrone oxygenase
VLWALIIATVAAGLFSGAAIYINAVEHPARISCGAELAVREFAPSYRRATVMQASLAITGCATGLWSAWVGSDIWVALAATLLGAVVPFTLIVILPTNKELLDPTLDPRSHQTTLLLTRWGRLHAARSILSTAAFVLFVLRLAA